MGSVVFELYDRSIVVVDTGDIISLLAVSNCEYVGIHESGMLRISRMKGEIIPF